MVLRLYLFSLYLTLFLSFALISLIILNVNPFISPVWMIILFYAVFFLLVISFFGLLGFYFKVWASNREVIFAHLLPTLRQAALVAFALTGLLFLYQIKVLSWWVAVLFVAAVVLIGLYFKRK